MKKAVTSQLPPYLERREIPLSYELPKEFKLINAIQQPSTLEILTVRVFSLESIASAGSRVSVCICTYDYTIHSGVCIKCNDNIITFLIQEVFSGSPHWLSHRSYRIQHYNLSVRQHLIPPSLSLHGSYLPVHFLQP